jgi:DNA-binding transcriptional MerR regulator
LSVRTLHYYDEIGLLQPSTVTGSGHRLYGPDELARLQRIKSLRQLGFSLDEIRVCLDAPEFSAHRVVELHIKRLRESIEQQKRLVELLKTLDASFSSGAIASPDDLVRAIEGMASLEFTRDEVDEIRSRGERLGAEHVGDVEREWPELIAQVRGRMLAGVSPDSDEIRPLADRWRTLVREFTGGNPSIEQKIRARFIAEPDRMRRAGLDSEILAYANRAIRALGS